MGSTIETAATVELKASLLRARNADGGWGYFGGKSSRLEPTCWGLLALADEASPDVLKQWPSENGLLLERAGGTPNFGFHGLALLALFGRKTEHQSGNRALVNGIERAKGVVLPNGGVNRQRNDIQAWSWIDETFSWVEPTACCLLALKKAGRSGIPADAKRIADAEAMLFDRCAINGGWNYGNSNMLGKELPPYIPTTALSLLALQDHPSHEAVLRSQAYLEKDALSERSSLALSLALVALRVLGRPTDSVASALVEQLPTTMALGNLHAMALALYALGTDHAALVL